LLQKFFLLIVFEGRLPLFPFGILLPEQLPDGPPSATTSPLNPTPPNKTTQKNPPTHPNNPKKHPPTPTNPKKQPPPPNKKPQNRQNHHQPPTTHFCFSLFTAVPRFFVKLRYPSLADFRHPVQFSSSFFFSSCRGFLSRDNSVIFGAHLKGRSFSPNTSFFTFACAGNAKTSSHKHVRCVPFCNLLPPPPSGGGPLFWHSLFLSSFLAALHPVFSVTRVLILDRPFSQMPLPSLASPPARHFGPSV